MSYLQAIVLGFVQGLGEFLPISSSAHLIVVPYIFNWARHSDQFDVALHLGTLVAVLAFFWSDIWHILGVTIKTGFKQAEGKLFGLIMLATVPAAYIGYKFEDVVDNKLRTAILAIAITMAVFGVLLWYVDKIAAKRRQIGSLTWFDALLIGFSQALALMPGVSRSGATMTTGLALGLNRESAARFSFLMSIPIIAGAGILKLRHITTSDINGPFIVGVVVAAIVGYLSIRWMLKYLQKGSYAIFTWYRIALAALVILVLVSRHG